MIKVIKYYWVRYYKVIKMIILKNPSLRDGFKIEIIF